MLWCKPTKSVVNGANIDPRRPIIEQMFISVFLIAVGQISAEKMYKIANAELVAHIAVKNMMRMSTV